jgi:anti-anti-sigma regulatory factor
MGQVEVVDRGSREIVVFLRGDITSGMAKELSAALDEVGLLERLDDLHRAVVDTREVTAFDATGLDFLRRLEARGKAEDYEVALSMTSKPVLKALEDARWPYATGLVV